MIYNSGKYNQNWETKKLSELGFFSRGVSKHRPRNDLRLFDGGGYPLVQTGNIKDANLFITSHCQEYGEFGLKQSKLWDKGTLCITIAANIAETAILSYPMCFPDSVVGFRANRDKSSEMFMYYVFEFIRSAIQNSASGSIQDNINIDYLTGLNFKVPTKIEQDKIVKVLSLLDKKIILNNKLNDNLQHQLIDLFRYLFFRKDVIPTLSKGCLTDIAFITMGQSPSGDSYNEEQHGCVFFQGSTDFGAHFPFARIYTSSPKRMANTFDTLLSIRAPIGTINIAFEDCCIGRGLAAIRGKNDNNAFVRYLLRSKQQYFNNINGNGTTFGSLTKEELFAMPIFIPSQSDTYQFEIIAESAEKQIYQNEKEIRQLTALRDWLLPMLMNGQATIED